MFAHEENTVTGSHLMLGEADFSYSYALVKRYPSIAAVTIATAYESEAALSAKYRNFKHHISYLREVGVTVLFNVDATAIHAHPKLQDHQFARIHFNFPCTESGYEDGGALRRILAVFFHSAKRLQAVGAKIYMGLAKPPHAHTSDERKYDDVFFMVEWYNIYDNARMAGYRFINKHDFDSQRYPHYRHVQTKQDRSARAADKYGKEYVFENTELNPKQILRLDKKRSQPPKTLPSHKGIMIPELVTDSDTTDYESKSTVARRQIKPINSVKMATVTIGDISRLTKKYSQQMRDQLTVSVDKILKLVDLIRAMELYLSQLKVKYFYGHPSSLGWKSHLACWRYRVQNYSADAESNQLYSANKPLFIGFLNTLLAILVDNDLNDTYLIKVVLEGLFYLYDYYRQPILNWAKDFLAKANTDWECKVIALSILMRNQHDESFRESTTIPLMLQLINEDPRLDWLVCSFLGSFDLSSWLIALEYRHYFLKLTDYRLIKILLKGTNVAELLSQQLLLPNIHFEKIIRYMVLGQLEQDSLSDNVSSAVFVPDIASMCWKYNYESDELEMLHLGIISNIFLPGQSYVEHDKGYLLTGNLRSRHQVVSMRRIAEEYLRQKNYFRALQYFKIPADYGDIESIYQIVHLYVKGLGNFYHLTVQDLTIYADKLRLHFDAGDAKLSYAFCCMALVSMINAEFDNVKKYAEMAYSTDSSNPHVLIYQAISFMCSGDWVAASKKLHQIRRNASYYKKGLLEFIEIARESKDFGDLVKHYKYSDDDAKSILLMYCGIVSYANNFIDQSIWIFNQIILRYPNHEVSIKYLQLLTSEKQLANNQLSEGGDGYELTFRSFSGLEEYIDMKRSLQLQSCGYRGYLAFIPSANNEIRFVDLYHDTVIINPFITFLADRIFHAETMEIMESNLSLIIKLVFGIFNVKRTPNTAAIYDKMEDLKVRDASEDELTNCQQSSSERSPVLTPLLSSPVAADSPLVTTSKTLPERLLQQLNDFSEDLPILSCSHQFRLITLEGDQQWLMKVFRALKAEMIDKPCIINIEILVTPAVGCFLIKLRHAAQVGLLLQLLEDVGLIELASTSNNVAEPVKTGTDSLTF